MAEKSVGELPRVSDIYSDSLFVVEQQRTASSATGEQVINFAKRSVKDYSDAAAKSATAAKASADEAQKALADVENAGKTATQKAKESAESAVKAKAAQTAVENLGVSAYSSESEATVTKLVTDTGVMLRFGLPRGERGPTGEAGATGPQGPVGPTGPQGKAFTYSDFTPEQLALLTGPTGPKGDTGPRGAAGPQGETGVAGKDGVSPTVAVNKSGKTTTVTITDATGAHTATITDGADGATGATGPAGPAGVNGISPVVKVSKSGTVTTVTITDATGDKVATINDGKNGTNGTNGKDGATGATGPTGPQGPAGKDATVNGHNVVTIVGGKSITVTNDGGKLTLDIGPYNPLITPEMHRNMYRGVYLGSAVTEEQRAAIADGSFSGLFVGDYWTISGVNYRIADINYWRNTYSTPFTAPHLVIVPDGSLGSGTMNDTNTTAEGYVGSKMYKEGLTAARQTIRSAFGSLVLPHYEYFTTGMENGKASSSGWILSTADLMSEIMVYGHMHFTAANTGVGVPKYYTNSMTQLALFRLCPEMIITRNSYWLRDFVGTQSWARVSGYGFTYYEPATSTATIRPVFAIGVSGASDPTYPEEPEIMEEAV